MSPDYIPPANQTKESPSQLYTDLIKAYIKEHRSDKRFWGSKFMRYYNHVGRLVRATKAKSLLDYGCGKGLHIDSRPLELPKSSKNKGAVVPSLREHLGLQELVGYDPGWKWKNKLPNKVFDGVVSFDVLEHIPKVDILWILKEIFTRADKFVFLDVACFPATKDITIGEQKLKTMPTIFLSFSIFHLPY